MKKDWMAPIFMLLFMLGLAFVGNERAWGWKSYEEADRILCGGYMETQQISVSTTGSTATTLVSANAKRPSLWIKNLSKNYDVGIGSNTSTLLTTGYVLSVATSPTSEIYLGSFTDAVYAYGAGTSADKPTVMVLECLVR